MKGRRPHAIWAPADVLKLMAMNGKFAFPADETGDKPVSPSAVTRWMASLWGRLNTKTIEAYDGKPGPAKGFGAIEPLLQNAGIPVWTPHAIRGALAS